MHTPTLLQLGSSTANDRNANIIGFHFCVRRDELAKPCLPMDMSPQRPFSRAGAASVSPAWPRTEDYVSLISTSRVACFEQRKQSALRMMFDAIGGDV
jgi:hypothetical protein